jgi:hypothetical protein
MHYEAKQLCYRGEWLVVPIDLFNKVFAIRVRAGENPDAVLEDLLDELSWSLDAPGVRPSLSTLRYPETGSRYSTPWPLRFRVVVVHADPLLAEELQFELERAGMRAPTFVVDAHTSLGDLQSFVALAPAVWIFGLAGVPPDIVSVLKRRAPECLFVLTGSEAALAPPLPEDRMLRVVGSAGGRASAASVAHAVRMRLLGSAGARDSRSRSDEHARAQLVLRTHLLRTFAQEKQAQSLAYQGWSLSLRRRMLRARARTIMLGEQAAALRAQARAYRGQPVAGGGDLMRLVGQMGSTP